VFGRKPGLGSELRKKKFKKNTSNAREWRWGQGFHPQLIHFHHGVTNTKIQDMRVKFEVPTSILIPLVRWTWEGPGDLNVPRGVWQGARLRLKIKKENKIKKKTSNVREWGWGQGFHPKLSQFHHMVTNTTIQDMRVIFEVPVSSLIPLVRWTWEGLGDLNIPRGVWQGSKLKKI
jgi:hypothetical protein